LGKLDVAVGYPEQWIDFSGVEIRPDDYFGNVRRIDRFLQTRELARTGKPVVIERFAVAAKTTPIAVNAGYNPQRNNVDITAAIVQPPLLPAWSRCGGELLHHRRRDRSRTDPRFR
jgi:putative endopeptidase